jgi:nitrite reductase (NADH) large subunit
VSTMAATAFPNYTQISSRLSVRAWQALRVGSLLGGLTVAVLLLVAEDTGLFIFWKVVIPALPLLWMIAPGLWRNLCPLAASNQTPRVLRLTRAVPIPNWFKEYGYVIAISLFLTLASLRKLGLDDHGPPSALLLLGAKGSPFVGGLVFKGKAGWCSTMCPLLPLQRIYGQTPFALVGNSHCQPCVGCVKNCYDFNPRVAYLADLNDGDPYWGGYRKLFVAALPGFAIAFFTTPDHPAMSVAEIYSRLGLGMLLSAGSFLALSAFAKVSAHKLTTLYGAALFTIVYWYAAPVEWQAISGDSAPEAVKWSLRIAALALAAVWLVRTYRKEGVFARENRRQASSKISVVAQRSLASRRAMSAGEPEVSFEPEGKRVVAEAGATLLELAESNDLKIEAGCRMGVCGADPVAIREGMENLSPIGDAERSTLDRLGLAPNTRMACCARVDGPVCVSVTPDKAAKSSPSRIAGFAYDRSVERVAVIGNGIAGVTAAEHVRRRHPACAIDLVADEHHHLYNRMGISRLIYGRSAMQGLYLNPDSWYEERGITTWLNTHAIRIDRERRTVVLGTGESVDYDRLILATGASSFVPPIEGFGAKGTFVLRAADDALAIRSFVQRHGGRRAVVAGGGLLGLEAAYALHKLGLRTAVLERSDRLLRRQLDERAAALLRGYIEGLGIDVVTAASTAGVSANGRVTGVTLEDGRMMSADLVLVAAGITPNVALARAADLPVNRGVLVDERMRTAAPAILACGDVAECAGTVAGLWPAAVEQAEVAADNAVGGEQLYVGAAPVTILKVVGIELTSLGRFEPAHRRDDRPRGRDGPAISQARDRRGRANRGGDPARLLPRGGAGANRDRTRLRRTRSHRRPARRQLGRAVRPERRAAAARGRAGLTTCEAAAGRNGPRAVLTRGPFGGGGRGTVFRRARARARLAGASWGRRR